MWPVRRVALPGSLLFFLIGPGLEAGVGPFVLTGWHANPAPAVVRIVGAAAACAGLAVLVWCFARFVREGGGTPSPLAPPTRLVVGGPYRWVRNPMYAATAALIIGQGLLLAQPILFAAAAAYVIALAALDRFVERPRLMERFGAQYAEYVRAVPGWIPWRRPWPRDQASTRSGAFSG